MVEGTMDLSGTERRKFHRFRVDLPVDYARLETKRLRAGIAENAMKIGTKLYIALPFSLGFQLTGVRALSQIIWKDVGLEAGWGRYKYGLKFLDIADEDRLKLKQLRADLAIQS
jgi:hypothetical protein